MSRDADSQQRLWLSLGYGGKSGPAASWRYWKATGEERTWIIAAPNGLAEFRQVDRTVYLGDRELLTAMTQWEATWRAVAYFYSDLVPTLIAPRGAACQGA